MFNFCNLFKIPRTKKWHMSSFMKCIKCIKIIKKNALSSICCGFIKFKGVAVKEVLK